MKFYKKLKRSIVVSYAVTFFAILLALNLLFFLFGQPEANSPMLGVLKAFFTGDISSIDWGVIITGQAGGSISLAILQRLALVGFIVVVILGLAYATGGNPLTGGGYGAVHVPLVFAAAMFVVFFLIPNFGFIGFPYPVDMIIYVIFGFMAAMGVFGLFKQE